MQDDYLRPLRLRARKGPQSEPTLRVALLRQLGWPAGRAGASRRARIAVKPPRTFDRRVIVKARVVVMAGGDASGERLASSARAHLGYVEREGVERDGSPGRAYGSERLTDQELRDQLLAPIPGEKHQFRMIVSPEDGSELDLTTFTRQLVQQIERDIGRSIVWGAVNHYNTDNPHTHLIVRGVDRAGLELRLDRAYISHGIRRRAQEIATRELGPRTVDQYRQQLQREVTQARFTSLDRRIQRRVVDHVVARDALDPIERERLRALETMGLASVTGVGWKLDPNWVGALRAAGERGDIIKQMHAAMRGGGDTARYLQVKRFEALPRDVHTPDAGAVSGRVITKGLSDRTPDAMYAVIEAPTGAAYYVPLWRSEIEKVREGDLVELRQLKDSWAHDFDAPLAAICGAAGHEFSERALRAELQARLEALHQAGLAAPGAAGSWKLEPDFCERAEAAPCGVGGPLDELLEQVDRRPDGTFRADDLVEQLVERVKLLAEAGIATASGDDRWQLAPNFRTRLAALDREQPKCHVSLRKEPMSLAKQVSYLGPTWLDSAKPTAHQAFGRELVELQRQRVEFLVAQGVNPGKDRMRDLRRKQRETVEERVGQASGLTPAKVDGFRGRFDRIESCPNGARYGVIVNQQGGSFVVVAVGKKAVRNQGREVELSFERSEYDGQQKLAIRPVRGRARQRDGMTR